MFVSETKPLFTMSGVVSKACKAFISWGWGFIGTSLEVESFTVGHVYGPVPEMIPSVMGGRYLVVSFGVRISIWELSCCAHASRSGTVHSF